MTNKLLAVGLFLAFAALAMPGTANHIIDCDDLEPQGDGADDGDSYSAPGCDEPQATDPTTWGAQVGAAFPVGDDYPVPTGPVCVAVAGAIGVVTGAIPEPTVQAVAIVAGQIIYEVVCPNGYVLGFNSGDTIVGFTACENNGTDPIADEPGTPSRQGQGGLCFMSPGFDGSPCAFANGATNSDGDSNGRFTTYNGGACSVEPADRTIIPDSAVARHWYKFTMVDSDELTEVAFTSQVADVSCTDSTGALAVNKYTEIDYQWLYMADAGHLTGFPERAPAGQNTVGSYTVGAGSNTGSACDGPAPWLQHD